MIGRKLALSLAAAVVVVTMSITPAIGACKPMAKGVRGCGNEIRGCLGNFCSGTKGKTKVKCKTACRQAVLKACRSDATECSASPSGAFVDVH